MSQILVIPDTHLKSAMLDMAEKILKHEKVDEIVILGDLLDDFYAKSETYDRFWRKFMDFYYKHKNKIVLLYGNHEVAYLINRPVTGNTRYGEKYAKEYAKLSPRVAYVNGKVIFSHAGVFDEFLRSRDLSDLSAPEAIARVNALPLKNLWSDESPLWARPQYRTFHTSGEWLDYIQVVGHTPMQKVEQAGNIISADVFSTNWGAKYGEERMIVIDTETSEPNKYS